MSLKNIPCNTLAKKTGKNLVYHVEKKLQKWTVGVLSKCYTLNPISAIKLLVLSSCYYQVISRLELKWRG